MSYVLAGYNKPDHVSDHVVVDFDFFNPPYHTDDLHLAWKRLQTEAPNDVVWSPRNGGHWIFLRQKDIHAVLADGENVEDRVHLVAGEERDFAMLPLAMRAPESLKYRATLNYDLSPRRVKVLTDTIIRPVAVALIEELREKGHCDFVHAFGEKLPTMLFLKLCNLPTDNIDRLLYVTNQLSKPDGLMPLDAAIAEVMEYLTPYIAERRDHPGDDLISRLSNSTVDGRRVTFEEALSLTSIALFGGFDTVAGSLGVAFRFLAENPDVRQKLANNPSYLPRAIDEIFRRLAINLTGRKARRDFALHGVSIKRGDQILLPMLLTGLDERVHEDPMSFNMDRPVHSTSIFGNGYHVCPGQILARAEMTVAIQEWLARIPDFELAEPDKVKMISGMNFAFPKLQLKWDPKTTKAESPSAGPSSSVGK